MAANVVYPDEVKWPIIEEFLAQCGNGAIVVPPEVLAQYPRELDQSDDARIDLLDGYAFGGDPDLMIDVARRIPPLMDGLAGVPNFALEALLEARNDGE